MAVVTFSGLHDAIETRPMTRSEIVGNDEIQRASDGFISREAENAGRAGIPEADGTGAIGRNDRIRCRCQNRFSQPVRNSHDFLVKSEFVRSRTFSRLIDGFAERFL
jgi:hypothetical protein